MSPDQSQDGDSEPRARFGLLRPALRIPKLALKLPTRRPKPEAEPPPEAAPPAHEPERTPRWRSNLTQLSLRVRAWRSKLNLKLSSRGHESAGTEEPAALEPPRWRSNLTQLSLRVRAWRSKLNLKLPSRGHEEQAATEQPQPSEAGAAHREWPHLPRPDWAIAKLNLGEYRPTPYGAAVCVIVVAIVFMATITYYGAQTFTKRAANTRASSEAQSFSAHSAKLATGDAFGGYIQILRDADDPIVSNKDTPAEQRIAAMQQGLYLNTNKFLSLTVANRAGDVLASTDPAITSMRDSQAFTETRSNLRPANSDVILPIPGKHGYVEYSAPLREPDGAVWGVLVGRADPASIWSATLVASVDDSRNVIINSDGRFAAGVPDDLLSKPWRGVDLGNGGVRADIAGVDSICGLAPIGKDTQIDRGLNVASCMAVSLIQVEHGRAMGKQGLVTVAASVLAVVLAAGATNLLLRGPQAPAEQTAEAETAAPQQETQPAPEAMPAIEPVIEEPAIAVAEPEPTPAPESEQEDQTEPESGPEPVPETEADPALAPIQAPVALTPPPTGIDALTLIEAYEQRNARLSERLRESVQAKLLVATSQIAEAYKLAAVDADAAAGLHARALEDLEHIRDRELRSIGQELHPGLIRLGLPSALKALRKELAASIKITLDVDATTDSVGGAPGRALIPPAERLVLYRFALEAARSLAAAGATECTASLQRRDDTLVLAVSGNTSEEEAGHFDRALLAASTLAIEASGGFVAVSRRDDAVAVSAELPAPPVAEMPEAWSHTPEEDEEIAELEIEAAALDLEETQGASAAADGKPAPGDTFVAEIERAAASAAADGEPAPGDAAGIDEQATKSAAAPDTADPDAPRPVAAGDPARGFAGAPNLRIVKIEEDEGEDEPEHVATEPPRAAARVAVEDIDLATALTALQEERVGAMSVSVNLDLPEGGAGLVPGLRATLYGLVQATVAALQASGAARCALSLREAAGYVMFSVISETDGTPFDAAPLKPYEAEVEAFGGYVAVSRRDNAVSVTAEVTAVTPEAAGGTPADASPSFVELLDGEPADGAEAQQAS